MGGGIETISSSSQTERQRRHAYFFWDKVGALRRAILYVVGGGRGNVSLSTLSTDAAGQLDVLGHDHRRMRRGGGQGGGCLAVLQQQKGGGQQTTEIQAVYSQCCGRHQVGGGLNLDGWNTIYRRGYRIS